jgi:hypothetical protein
VRLAGTVLSEPAAFAAPLAALALATHALFGGAGTARGRLAAILGGLLGAWAIAIRPLDGLAAAAGGLVLVVVAARSRGTRPAAAGLGWIGVGALAFVLGVGALLVRSDRAPWDWTAYDFWIDRYGAVSDWWQPRLLVERTEREDGSTRSSGLRYAARVLAGERTRNDRDRQPPGLPFAALALLGALALLRARRAGAAATEGERALALALAAWFAAHLLGYSAYYYRLPRFFGAPAALLVLAGSWGAAVAIAGGSRARRATAVALVAWIGGSMAIDAGRSREPVRRAPARRSLAAQVEARVEAWREMPPRRRRRAPVMPFDPLEAQAFGVLRPSEAHRFPWGELPPTEHAFRFAARSRRPGAAAGSVDTPGSGP